MRTYTLEDLELLKKSPMRWRPNDWADMGMCEGTLRGGPMHVGGRVNTRMHILIQRARVAYGREGQECPWDDQYEIRTAAVPKTALQCAVNIKELFLAVVQDGSRVALDVLRATAQEYGYKGTSISTALREMTEEGLITRRDGDVGVYVITAAGTRTVLAMLARPPTAPSARSKFAKQPDPSVADSTGTATEAACPA